MKQDLKPVIELDANDPAPSYARIQIDGMIDRGRASYLERSLQRAVDAGVTTVITEITSYGGELMAGLAMMDACLAHRDLELIAVVESRAISAAAALAFAHDHIYLTPAATIGNIGIVRQTPEGGIEYAAEKYETMLRTKLANAAEINNWPRDILIKMTALNQPLYRINDQGEEAWVIEDRLPTFLADRPHIDKENDVVLFLGEDRLLTATAQEAVDYGIATGLVDSLAQFYQQRDLNPEDILDLTPTGSEELSGLWRAGHRCWLD